MTSSGLTAAILIGGRSTRMNTNKGMLALEPSGSTVLARIVDRVRPVVDELVLVGSASDEYAFLNITQVEDFALGNGPLGGICSALRWSPNTHVLVVACDMPFLSVPLLRYMAAVPRKYDVLVPFVGQLQPLHAIYSQSCLPMVEESLGSGSTRVTGWFDQATIQIIDEATVARYDPHVVSTFNMNTPAQLEAARRIHRALDGDTQ